jgi:hypothetical protein
MAVVAANWTGWFVIAGVAFVGIMVLVLVIAVVQRLIEHRHQN